MTLKEAQTAAYVSGNTDVIAHDNLWKEAIIDAVEWLSDESFPLETRVEHAKDCLQAI